MRGLVLLLVVSAAVASPQGPRPSATPEGQACNELLKSVEEKVGDKAAVDKCIAEQPGLQATLEKLKASSTSSGPHSAFPTVLLSEAGLTTEVLALRKCIARENKQVITAADGSLKFDVNKLKSDLAAKVAGTSSEANTALGLNSCPEALLVNFEVFKYMGCIKIYCATGAAPTN